MASRLIASLQGWLWERRFNKRTARRLGKLDKFVSNDELAGQVEAKELEMDFLFSPNTSNAEDEEDEPAPAGPTPTVFISGLSAFTFGPMVQAWLNSALRAP
ncbi:MAG TPA: hypothetical protein VN081_04245 [Dongiaceae bacterium]|nr:hypothetical protein [Dongiaceae bacterium]